MISFDKYKDFFNAFYPKKCDTRILTFSADCIIDDVLTYSQVKQVLEAIKQSVHSFHGLPKQEALKNCKLIREGIQGLIEYAKDVGQELIIKERAENEKLVSINRQYVQVFQKLQRDKTQLGELESHRQALQERRDVLSKSIQQLSSEMTELKEKIQGVSIRRVDALTDLIPGVGIIGGLVTGRYERMIPFYSQVIGIISVAGQDKECFQIRLDAKDKELGTLNAEINSISAKVDMQRRIINLMNEEIIHLGSKKIEFDIVIKALGEQLTCLKKFHSSLKRIQNKYEFLSIDVDTINKLVNIKSLNRSVVDNFIDDLRDVQLSIDNLLIQEMERLFSTPKQDLTFEQSDLYNRLNRLYACLNVSEHISSQFSRLISENLGRDEQNKLHHCIYLVCKKLGYDTNNPEFGKKAITDAKIPTVLFKHAILEHAFQSCVISKGSPLLI